MDLTIITTDHEDIEIALGITALRGTKLIRALQGALEKSAPSGEIELRLLVEQISTIVKTPGELAWLCYRIGSFAERHKLHANVER